MGQRHADTDKMAAAYKRGSRAERSAILDTLLGLTGWHRDHARHAVKAAGVVRPPRWGCGRCHSLRASVRPVRDSLHPRRYVLKNKESTDRLLMFKQLHANGQEREVEFRKLILDWLLANDGRPNWAPRSIADPADSPSLC